MDGITVIGAGFAGCEAAWAAAQRGVHVTLVEMKPVRFSPAHRLEFFCEPVCSNSFKAARVNSAAGLLKEEMRRLGSLVVPCAEETAVPAGGALAVDREKFSRLVTEKIKAHPNITVESREADCIPEGVVIIATGPLTDGKMAECISGICGGYLSFYDAAAPIVTAESVEITTTVLLTRRNMRRFTGSLLMRRVRWYMILTGGTDVMILLFTRGVCPLRYWLRGGLRRCATGL